jgi:hypothetical protein
MLSLNYAEYHLCYVICAECFTECHLHSVSIMLSIIYTECHLCPVSIMLSIIYAVSYTLSSLGKSRLGLQPLR